MRWFILVLCLFQGIALGGPPANTSTIFFWTEPEHDVLNSGALPVLELGNSYIRGQQKEANAFTGFDVSADGPQQCSQDQPCLDESCCNSDGKCGYQKQHCNPDPPGSCLHNCDAKAMCGVDSKDGNKKCGLNLCCSYYGWCGTDSFSCGDKDEQGNDTPCQKDFGKCEIVQPPSCAATDNSASNGRRIAFYQGWNTRTRACQRIWPNDIDTNGLTHINFAFAHIDPQSFKIVPAHEDDVALYTEFTALKTDKLQTWISVGGWDFSSDNRTRTTWSDMVSTKDNRNAFIVSVLAFMNKYGFQGLDLHWQYPVDEKRGGREGDTAGQVALFEELKFFLNGNFGLSSILVPKYDYLRHMDPKALEPQVDWFNFQAYDLHGHWDVEIPTLGPRMRRHTDIKEIDKDLLALWYNGVDPKKINLGLAYYGRGYTAKSQDCVGHFCEFTGPSKGGKCTQQDGILSNREIKKLIKERNLTPTIDNSSMIQHIAWDDQWMQYDDTASHDLKMQFANERCLGGSSLWAVDFVKGGQGNANSGVPEDVYINPTVWFNNEPKVPCSPPCTIVLPPYSLPSMTTISWPPLTTTLVTIEGGDTQTITTSLPTKINGTVTQFITTLLTVKGGTSNTLTTTIDIPPFTTNMIEFWPISIEATENGTSTIEPVPRVFPPSVNVTLNACQLTFPPTHYPGFMVTSTTPGYGGFCLQGPYTESIQPMPTVGIWLPSGTRSVCKEWWCWPEGVPKPTGQYQWPTAITWSSGSPEPTCTANCGNKHCEEFGCPCEGGRENCNPPGGEDSDSDDGDDNDNDDDDDNDNDDDDDNDGGGGGGGGKNKDPACPLWKRLLLLCGDTIGGGRKCGWAGCGGGCGWICGGGCGTSGCGGCNKLGGCGGCPLGKCVPGCKEPGGNCGPTPFGCKTNCPVNPTGGPKDKPKCEEKDKTTITNYWVSCTKSTISTSSSTSTSTSCSTTHSATMTGCGLLPTTTTTTKGGACTRAPLNLDDDEGDNDNIESTSTFASESTATSTSTSTSTSEGIPPFPSHTPGNCDDCAKAKEDCLNRVCPQNPDWGRNTRPQFCLDRCHDVVCLSEDSPEACRFGGECASSTCPNPLQPEPETPGQPECSECHCCHDFKDECQKRKCKDDPDTPECFARCNTELCWAPSSPYICRIQGKCARSDCTPETDPERCRCDEFVDDCKKKEPKDALGWQEQCLLDSCFSTQSPSSCQKGGKCASKHCPEKYGDPLINYPENNPKEPLTRVWQISFHQVVQSDGAWTLDWYLKDSNGDAAGKGDGNRAGTTRNWGKVDYGVEIINKPFGVFDKDKDTLEFQLERSEWKKKCRVKWTLGSKDGKKKPKKPNHCDGGPKKEDQGCDDVQMVTWTDANNGAVERYFYCFYTDI